MKLKIKFPSLRTSIQNRLLIPIVTLVIVGMGIVVASSYYGSSHEIIANATETMTMDLKNSAEQLDSWVNDRLLDMKHWSGDEVFHESLGEGYLAESARDGACSELKRLREDYSYYTVLILANTQGKIVAAYDAVTYAESEVIKTVDIGKRDYFQKVMNTGKPAITDILTSKSSGLQCVMFAYPVLEENKVKGVLVGSIEINNISKILGSDNVTNKNRYSLLTDSTGLFIVHPDPEQRGKGNLKELSCGPQFYEKDLVPFEYKYNGTNKMGISYQSKTTGWMLAETCDLDVIYQAALKLGYEQTGIALAVIITLSLVILFVVRSISKAIKHVVDRLNDIASGDGDLTQRVDESRKDELGQLAKAFNTFVKKIHSLISDVSGVANDVAAASGQMAATSSEMAESMNEQSRRATEVAAAVEEMSSTVSHVAQMSSDTARAADQAGAQAQSGGKIVSNTVEGMRAISDVVNESAKAIFELGKRGEQIGQIISVINDIADQTNLLALNAAIEAARAGEHGRGFAVVADEVRKLAERTTTATKEVAQSITAIQTETDTAVNRMNEGTKRVEEGVNLAEQAGQSLHSIVEGSDKVARLIQSIAASSEQQSSTSQIISQNVDSINATTRHSAEGAQQAALAANQLSEKSEQLRSLVGQFKL